MAKIVVVTHEYDRLLNRGGVLRAHESRYLPSGVIRLLGRTGAIRAPTRRYMLGPILLELARRGHFITVTNGIPQDRPEADIAILHVDATYVPSSYTDFARSFPICLNLRVDDISKRVTSDSLIGRDTDWSGPVIVKSNLNCRGAPEASLNRRAARRGRPLPFPDVKSSFDYTILASAADVPEATWHDDGLIVEKFLAEPDREGFGIRFWTFLGDEERCDLCISTGKMVKANSLVRFEPSPVPDRLRQIRERLGLDFGKIDFVIHDGEAVVLDVNKTVGMPPSRKGSDWPIRYASSVERYLKAAR